MKDDKDIGLAFKEQLDSLNNIPEDIVWENIQGKLDQKKKQRRILLLLLLLFTLSMGIVLLSSKQNITNDKKQSTTKKNTSITKETEAIKHLDSSLYNQKNKTLTPTKNTPITKNRKTKIINYKTNKYPQQTNAFTIPLQQQSFHFPKDYYLDRLHLSINSKKEPKHQKKKKINPPKSKWSISAISGLNTTYFYTEESAIDVRLKNNDKDENTSKSLGLYLNYQLSKRTTIRVGLQKMSLTYRTKNIDVTNLLSQSIALQHITINDSETTQNFFMDNQLIDLREEINYIEIPMEFKYALLQKKLDFNIVGGYSLLYLNGNTIYGSAKNHREFQIGTSSIINNTNFSLNMGFETNIKVVNSLYFGLGITYKHYFATYNKSSISNPFSMNIQALLTYKF